MRGLEEYEGHVGARVHGLRVMLESCKVDGISCRDVQLGLFAYGRSIKRRFHVEVVTEGHVVLRMAQKRDKRKPEYYNYLAFKHVCITLM